MASQLITWALAFILTVFLPRFLGAEVIGKFQLGGSIWALMSIVVTFGMDTLLTKEIARNQEQVNQLFLTSLLLRFVIFLAGFLIITLYVHVARYSADTIEIINIVGVSTLVWQIAGGCGALLQGLEHMEFISYSDMIGKTFVTVVSLVALLLGYGVIVIAWISVASAVVTLAIQIFGINKVYRIQGKVHLNLIGWMLKSSYPYLIVTGFLVAYNQIDVIIISLLINEKQIGWYSAASRLFTTFLFVPSVLITALFPVFSRMHVDDPDALKKLLNKSLDFLLLVGIPIGFGIFAIADQIILLLYGSDFVNAGPILAVMGIVLVTTYLNAMFGKYYISTDRQKLWTWVMGAAAVASIPLDLVLVPLCQRLTGNGALGGSFSYLVTEGLMMTVGFICLPKGVMEKRYVWFAARVLMAGLLMMATAWVLRGYFILIPIIVGAVVYAGAVLVFKILSPEDWDLLKRIYQSALSKFRRTRPEPVS